jgi:hypothetical protein
MNPSPDTSTPTDKPRRIYPARKRITFYAEENPLMGAQEAALALGVRQNNLRVLGDTSSGMPFPEPLQTLACGSIWLTKDILRYRDERRKHPPLPGPKAQRVAAAT